MIVPAGVRERPREGAGAGDRVLDAVRVRPASLNIGGVELNGERSELASAWTQDLLGALWRLIPACRADHEGLCGRQAVNEDRSTVQAISMLPAEDLFVYVYVLIDDLITAGSIAISPRPGPVPACSDAELL